MKNHELIEKVGGVGPEFKVGDLVCFKKCELPEFFGGVYTIEGWSIHGMVNGDVVITGGRRVHESVLRHATRSEKAAGHRIDQSNTDDVVDFGYHVSPLTVVTELHVNEVLRLNELG